MAYVPPPPITPSSRFKRVVAPWDVGVDEVFALLNSNVSSMNKPSEHTAISEAILKSSDARVEQRVSRDYLSKVAKVFHVLAP